MHSLTRVYDVQWGVGIRTGNERTIVSIMKKFQFCLCCLWLLAGVDGTLMASGSGSGTPVSKQGKKTESASASQKGIVELKFEDFFASPIGPRGLELTEKVRSLDGKRVRIVGFMVRQEKSYRGVFIMAPLPVQTDEDHYGAGDDLPPATLYVLVQATRMRWCVTRKGCCVSRAF